MWVALGVLLTLVGFPYYAMILARVITYAVLRERFKFEVEHGAWKARASSKSREGECPTDG